MKLEDVKVGMKVYVLDKTYPNTCILKYSNIYRRAISRNQPYLYVINIKKNCILLHYNIDSSDGDFFYASDIEPYITYIRKQKLNKLYDNKI